MDFQTDKVRRSWDFTAFGGVGLVVCIIISNFLIFNLVFIPVYYEKYPWLGAFVFFEINTFVFLLVWSYYKVCFTGPGFLSHRINDSFPNVDQIKQKQKLIMKYKYAKGKEIVNENEDLESEVNLEEIKRIASNPALSIQETGYCFKCSRVKLPRTHHCKMCNKCVIRMDHHCPWTGNCIGLYNHKYFILFLIYATISVGQIGLIQGYCEFRIPYFYKGFSSTGEILVQAGCVMCIGLTISIGFLGWFQIYMGSKNLTTVESHSKELRQSNPFSKGAMRNFEEIFGTERKYWFLPIAPQLQSEEYLFLLKTY